MELSQIAGARLVHRWALLLLASALEICQCALLRLLAALKAWWSALAQMPRQERAHPPQVATAVTIV
jgi:hypothetical protein